MLEHIHTDDKTAAIQPDNTRDGLEQRESSEVSSVWEASRRRSQHSRHAAAQARTQGKRRHLRRLRGRR